jgi:hypothetical protein
MEVPIERCPKDPLPFRPESPASFPDLSIRLRCYSEATEAVSHRIPIAAHANCATPITALLLHARTSRHGTAEFLVRSEGGRILCDFNNLSECVTRLHNYQAKRCLSIFSIEMKADAI